MIHNPVGGFAARYNLVARPQGESRCGWCQRPLGHDWAQHVKACRTGEAADYDRKIVDKLRKTMNETLKQLGDGERTEYEATIRFTVYDQVNPLDVLTKLDRLFPDGVTLMELD